MCLCFEQPFLKQKNKERFFFCGSKNSDQRITPGFIKLTCVFLLACFQRTILETRKKILCVSALCFETNILLLEHQNGRPCSSCLEQENGRLGTSPLAAANGSEQHLVLLETLVSENKKTKKTKKWCGSLVLTF